jgi:hypothetical protein
MFLKNKNLVGFRVVSKQLDWDYRGFDFNRKNKINELLDKYQRLSILAYGSS